MLSTEEEGGGTFYDYQDFPPMPPPIHSPTSHDSDLSKAKAYHVTPQLKTQCLPIAHTVKYNPLTWPMRPYRTSLLSVSLALFSPCWAPVTDNHLQFAKYASILLHQLFLLPGIPFPCPLASTLYCDHIWI